MKIRGGLSSDIIYLPLASQGARGAAKEVLEPKGE